MRIIKSRWHTYFVCDKCNTIVGTIFKRKRARGYNSIRNDHVDEYCPYCHKRQYYPSEDYPEKYPRERGIPRMSRNVGIGSEGKVVGK
jgi:RNase P subunit RPR2